MPAKKTTAPKWLPGKRVRLRLYRHGLGDCFLLTFAGKTKPVHVMIDCGVVLGTKNPADAITPVAQDIKAVTGGKVDVLVITHEHWDHLSGFTAAQAQNVFKDITFGELWMAWTEDPKDNLAKQLRREHEQKKNAAKMTKQKLAELVKAGHKIDPQRTATLTGVLDFFGAAAADDAGSDSDDAGTTGSTTGAALAWLKQKIERQQTFLPGREPLKLPGVPGLRIFVLGPPRDAQKLGSTNPRKGEGYGLADAFAASAGFLSDPAGAARHQPFAAEYRCPAPAPGIAHSYAAPDSAWRRIDADWLSVGERLALQLDSDTNNTSLVLAFEFIETQEVLLFVGDAQAGNWRSWDDLKWEVPGPGGAKQTITAESLLQHTIFYKVGHHGSHNATLRDKGLERMPDGEFISFIPVDEDVAHNVKQWKHMPLPALCTRLKDKSAAVLRTDSDTVEGKAPAGAKIVPDKKKLYFDVWF